MVKVQVPATSANLGPGFDCLGLALNLYARFEFTPLEEGVVITGCEPQYANARNLVYRAYAEALAGRGIQPRGLRLHIDSAIPPARGLGSSAACTIGGILGADALHGLNLDHQQMLDLATRLEGHPDNAAPALFGGLRVSLMEEGKAHSLPARVHPGLRFLALVPGFELATEHARAALPSLVSLKDAVYNLSHTAMLLQALEKGSESHLRLAMRDRLHQDARLQMIPQGAQLKELAERTGAIACCLSGAGPSLLCLYTDPAFPGNINQHILADFPAFQALPLRPCPHGAVAERTVTP